MDNYDYNIPYIIKYYLEDYVPRNLEIKYKDSI